EVHRVVVASAGGDVGDAVAIEVVNGAGFAPAASGYRFAGGPNGAEFHCAGVLEHVHAVGGGMVDLRVGIGVEVGDVGVAGLGPRDRPQRGGAGPGLVAEDDLELAIAVEIR